MLDLLGYLAAALTTVAFFPQVLKAFKTKSTKDMSLLMWLLLSVGVLCWLIYGIELGSGPIIVANGVTLVLASAVLALKIIHG
jgi:MtN3 and saliva related transmembrane protein